MLIVMSQRAVKAELDAVVSLQMTCRQELIL